MRALRLRRREVRRRLSESLGRLRRTVRELPSVKKARQRRRLRRLLAALAAALLLFLLQCPPEATGPAPAPVAGEPGPAAKTVALPPRRPSAALEGRLARTDRTAFDVAAKPPPAWMDAFRLQVSARSTRLAACFQGIARPGALRWTASVQRETGVVSEQQLEPVGTTEGLNEEQLACLMTVLSTPHYKLASPTPDPESTALLPRVGMVIEF